MVAVLKLALILLEAFIVNVMMDMISLMVALQTVLVHFIPIEIFNIEYNL